ncbi:MAG: DUF2062 domain-containing protein [Symploca sp. SIO3E6]|nr:DUF2062 domain-containing protein [Caldora sp. SIO3E6]
MSRSLLQSNKPHLPSVAKPDFGRSSQLRISQLSFRRRLKYFYWRLARMQGSSRTIARGFACGVFAGMLPLFGLQTILGVLLAVPLRGNKILAMTGTWISNPLTYVPIYTFNFHVGQWLLNKHDLMSINFDSWQQIKESGAEISLIFLVGCLAVGLVSGIFSYFISLRLITKFRAAYHLQRQRRNWHSHHQKD